MNWFPNGKELAIHSTEFCPYHKATKEQKLDKSVGEDGGARLTYNALKDNELTKQKDLTLLTSSHKLESLGLGEH